MKTNIKETATVIASCKKTIQSFSPSSAESAMTTLLSLQGLTIMMNQIAIMEALEKLMPQDVVEPVNPENYVQS